MGKAEGRNSPVTFPRRSSEAFQSVYEVTTAG